MQLSSRFVPWLITLNILCRRTFCENAFITKTCGNKKFWNSEERLNLVFLSFFRDFVSFTWFSQKLSILRHILLHNTYIDVAIAVIRSSTTFRSWESSIHAWGRFRKNCPKGLGLPIKIAYQDDSGPKWPRKEPCLVEYCTQWIAYSATRCYWSMSSSVITGL